MNDLSCSYRLWHGTLEFKCGDVDRKFTGLSMQWKTLWMNVSGLNLEVSTYSGHMVGIGGTCIG